MKREKEHETVRQELGVLIEMTLKLEDELNSLMLQRAD